MCFVWLDSLVLLPLVLGGLVIICVCWVGYFFCGLLSICFDFGDLFDCACLHGCFDAVYGYIHRFVDFVGIWVVTD